MEMQIESKMQNVKADILERYDLLDYFRNRTDLRKVASTGGGEWAGPCPFCGGKDRFRVQPYHTLGGRWMCRVCSPSWGHNVIDFYMREHNCDFVTAIRALSGESPDGSNLRTQMNKIESQSTSANKKEAMHTAITLCEEGLWGNANPAALDYLHSRGLEDITIRRFHLGYSMGIKVGDLWIPRGITIPNIVHGEVHYIKIRLIPGEACRCSYCRKEIASPGVCPHCGKVTKYKGVKGNKTSSLFNAEDLPTGNVALIVEGEINAMTAFQEINDVVAVASVGSATNRIGLAVWGPYLFYPKLILVTYDEDHAGSAGKESLLSLSEKCVSAPLPSHHEDLNEFYCNGGDLWKWIEEILDLYSPIDSEVSHHVT
jgi:DNA primase